MKDEGPQLEALLHRLADCPAEFLEVTGDERGIDVAAVVCDMLRPMTSHHPEESQRNLLSIRKASVAEQTLVSIVAWLLADEYFRARGDLVPAIGKLMASPALSQLAKMVKPEKFVSDPERREELVRISLASLRLLPRGETHAQAADRLGTLDTVERERVLRATAAAERRAREVREAMARQRAQESASRYGE